MVEEEEKPSHLSHASRRVIIHNIYKYSRPNDITRLLETIKQSLSTPESIKILKSKKPPHQDWVSVTMESDDMAQMFIDGVNNGKFGKQKGNSKFMFARIASERGDDRQSNGGGKRGRDGQDAEDEGGKRGKMDLAPLDDDGVRDSMTPLWKDPYEKQLKWKWRNMVNKSVKKITKEILTTFRYVCILYSMQFYFCWFHSLYA